MGLFCLFVLGFVCLFVFDSQVSNSKESVEIESSTITHNEYKDILICHTLPRNDGEEKVFSVTSS